MIGADAVKAAYRRALVAAGDTIRLRRKVEGSSPAAYLFDDVPGRLSPDLTAAARLAAGAGQGTVELVVINEGFANLAEPRQGDSILQAGRAYRVTNVLPLTVQDQVVAYHVRGEG